MTVSYDVFTGEFLSKVTEFDFLQLPESDRQSIIDGYMRRALSNSTFRKACNVDFLGSSDDELRCFSLQVDEEDLTEIADIVSEGMVVQWLKPYVYQQELLRNVMNTRDYTLYSPAELLMRIGNAYQKAQKDYIQMIREYSYNHGDLTDLHL